MEAGEICRNTANVDGGGVLNHGASTMRGGTIWGNTAVNGSNGEFGGGVLAWAGTVALEGGFRYGSDAPEPEFINTPDAVHQSGLNGDNAVWPAGITGYEGTTAYPGGGLIPNTTLTVRAETP
jgi:hypothetical protein